MGYNRPNTTIFFKEHIILYACKKKFLSIFNRIRCLFSINLNMFLPTVSGISTLFLITTCNCTSWKCRIFLFYSQWISFRIHNVQDECLHHCFFYRFINTRRQKRVFPEKSGLVWWLQFCSFLRHRPLLLILHPAPFFNKEVDSLQRLLPIRLLFLVQLCTAISTVSFPGFNIFPVFTF